MVKKIIAAVVLITLLTVAIVQAMDKKAASENTTTQATTAKSEGLQVGAKAPDFELKTLSGDEVKLSSLKGKKVMLNFWATWCPPCKAEMPEMEKFYRQAGSNVTILAVNIDPQNDVKGFVNQNGITFPILLDSDGHVNQIYQILSIPTTYFINSQGIIQNKYTGAMNLDMMQQYTSQIN